MSFIKGESLMVFLESGKSIAFSTSHTLNVNAEVTSTATKDNGGGEWQTNEISLLSWEATTENLCGDPRNGYSYDELYDLLIKKEPIKLVFGLKSTLPAKGEYYEVPEGGWKPKDKSGYEGMALLTALSLNAACGEHATFTATFTGTGALKKLNTTVSVMSLNETASTTKASSIAKA